MEFIETHICKYDNNLKDYPKSRCLICYADENVSDTCMTQEEIDKYNQYNPKNMHVYDHGAQLFTNAVTRELEFTWGDRQAPWGDTARFEITPREIFINQRLPRIYNGKQIAIFGITRMSGQAYFDGLISHIDPTEIYNLTRNHHMWECILFDGTTYRLLPSNEASRGHRYNEVYIETGIPRELLPMLWPYREGVEPTVTYFD